MRPPFAFMLLCSSALAFTGPPNILLLMPVRARGNCWAGAAPDINRGLLLTSTYSPLPEINLHHERTNQPLSPSPHPHPGPMARGLAAPEPRP